MNLKRGEIDILVGTQMVSKGLDFDNVSLVGVFDIDRMINFPDFRSIERTFSINHSSKWPSRKKAKKRKSGGSDREPEQHILHWIENDDYEAFYQAEMEERKKLHLPHIQE